MLKKSLFLGLAVLLPSYCYSDSIAPYYGTTGNAAANGYVWGMDSVLPSGIPGLDINTVIYRYTPLKETADDMKVHVQNEHANGNGYIFRETDDWSGKAGGVEIRKVIPVTPSNRSLWGDGSIEVEGQGEIEDANVIYGYKVNPCYDPQFDPNCPGYQVQVPEIPEVDYNIYDAAANGDASQDQWDPNNELYEDEEELSEEELAELEAEEEKDSKERLEKALAAADNSALFANALAVSQMIDTINAAVNMSSYYNATIPGGNYSESIVLVDKKLPENKRGLRNGLAQQLLHQKMIDMQYNK